MEYSFKASKNSETTTVTLDDYRLIVRKGPTEEIIPYASIIAVRINSSGSRFNTHIYPDAHSPVLILSKSVSENGAIVNQSGGYSLLVRVLHHHLERKSKAVFRTGTDLRRLWFWALTIMFVSYLLSITLHYFGFGMLNPYWQTLLLSTIATAVVVAPSAHKLPRNYDPGNIPIQFLP